MSDRDAVLARLREGPVHSLELRREGITGNPSQRIAELEERGYGIERTSAPWSKGGGRRRPGTIYRLTHEPDTEVGGGGAFRPRQRSGATNGAPEPTAADPGAGPGGADVPSSSTVGTAGPGRLFEPVQEDAAASALTDPEWA